MMQAASVVFNNDIYQKSNCSIKCLCLKFMHNYSVAKRKIKIGSGENMQILEQKTR